MSNSYIKFSSVTYVQKAKIALLSFGIDSNIAKNTDNLGNGCSYRLFVKGDLKKAYEIIMRLGIKNMGVNWGSEI